VFADAGAVPVRLGDTVLRTSTAGPAALAALSLRLGRWN
jgi:16S rRNA (uracil1498-N3)-methyltransferase